MAPTRLLHVLMTLGLAGGCSQNRPLTNRRARRLHLQPPGTPLPPPAAPATNLAPAELAGIVEDHAFEQFFFDARTRDSLLEFMACYERPLLLCCPSLAVAAEEVGQGDYLLLDRDERFCYLGSRYRPFDLAKPTRIDGYAYDAVFCDPPFANLELETLRKALDGMAPNEQARSAPLFIAYNSRREQALLSVFAARQLERKMQLGYCSVKPKTQQHLCLYGPVSWQPPGSP